MLTHSETSLTSGDLEQSVEEWYHLKTMKENNDDGPRTGGTRKCANLLTDLEMSGDHKKRWKACSHETSGDLLVFWRKMTETKRFCSETNPVSTMQKEIVALNEKAQVPADGNLVCKQSCRGARSDPSRSCAIMNCG